MKICLLTLSLVLNASLIFVIVTALRESPSVPSTLGERTVSHGSSPESNPIESVSVAGLGEPFHWSTLESTDYEVYRDNLRQIGCPESTLADIITGEVNAQYLDQADVIANSVGQEFWELIADGENLWKRIEARAESLKALSNERDAVLGQLLGDAHNTRGKMFQEQENFLRRKALLDFLPPDKLELCLTIDAKYDRLRAELDQPDLLPMNREAQRKVLNQQHENEILESLSKSEAAELRLRQSPSVAICSQLLDFTATQDELRGIVSILDQAGTRPSQNYQRLVPSEAAQPLKALLGSERYALFARACDDRYHQASALGEKLQLPGTFAATVYGMQVDFEDLASEIRQQTIDEDTKRDLLGALESEAAQRLRAFIGPELQEKFAASDYTIGWVTRLSHVRP
jgi:hypothetical protein